MPIAVALTWSLALLSLLTGLTVVNPFGTILMLVVSLSYIPLFIVGIHDEYRLAHPRTWLLLIMTILYTYHWIPAMLSGLSHIVSRQTPEWLKNEPNRPRLLLRVAGLDQTMLCDCLKP